MKKVLSLLLIFILGIFVISCSRTTKGSAINEKENKGVKNQMKNTIQYKVLKEEEIPEKFKSHINKNKENKGYLYLEDSEYCYVAIFSGKKPTGGYSIKVLSLNGDKSGTKISIKEDKPKDKTKVTQALTYPYVVIRSKDISANLKVIGENGEILNSVLKEELY